MDEGLILAVETSSQRGSVALGRGWQVAGWRGLSAERRHAAELLPAIAELLNQAGAQPQQVQIICFSQGPGSFTGLRVAASLARMWQSATSCRVVAVPTLEVVARNALRCREVPPRLAVLVDARQGRVFGAVFAPDGDELRTVVPAGLHEVTAWLAGLERPCAVLGAGVSQHQTAILDAGLQVLPEEYWWPDAREVLAAGRRYVAAGRFCSPGEIRPAYLRPPECEEVYERRRAEAQARHGYRPS